MHELLTPTSQASDPARAVPQSEGLSAIPDLPELRTPLSIADAYAQFIGQVHWQWFCTLTFRPHFTSGTGGVHPERADKAFRYFISCINRELYGATWHKRHHGGLQWCRGTEFHKDGRLHFHAVVCAHGDDINTRASRYEWHEFWFKHFGRNQIEQPRSQDEICRYVSKYVTKDGLIDFSKNYGAWLPTRQNWQENWQTGNLIPDKQ